MTPGRPLPLVGLVLALLGAGVSGYLTIEHGRGASPICGIGQGCEVVAQSSYAALGGIPTAAFGMLMYLVLAVLYGVRLLSPPPAAVDASFRSIALAVTLLGAGVSGWLTYVQLFVLDAVCVWCATSAGLVMLLLVLAVADASARRRAIAGYLGLGGLSSRDKALF